MSFVLYLRIIIGSILLILSTGLFAIQIMGVFKMKYILNRMHSAAIGDALALGLAFLGLIIINGINFTTFKLLLVPCFMFFSSPVSSHLIARMEVETTKNTDQFKNVTVRDLDSLKEEDN